MDQNTQSKKTISILGCGWFGFPFAKSLVKAGYIVKGSTTTAEKTVLLQEAGIISYLINLEQDLTAQHSDFFASDILVCCIPPKRDPALQQQYVSKITKVAEAVRAAKTNEFILISSTSVFGDHNQTVNEDDNPQPDSPSGKIILQAEQKLKDYQEIRPTIVRFAGLFGPGRDPGRFFAGKTAIPNGAAVVNLIELTDCIGILTKIIELEKFGLVYHACSPDHPTRDSFYTAAARRSGLAVPEFLIEKKNWKIIQSTRVDEQLNYKFHVQLNTLVNQ